MTSLDHITRVLAAKPLPRSPESRLQNAIAEELADHGVTFSPEVCIAPGSVVDFLVDDRIAMEVKVDGSLSDVTRQLHRYAQSDRVEEVLLVTTRARHAEMPPTLGRKPVRVLRIGGEA